MVSTAIQLFTVCEADAPLSGIVDRIEAAGYDGVEYNEEWFPLLQDSNGDEAGGHESPDPGSLATAGAQIPLEVLENRLDAVVSTYAPLGCRDYVVPYLDEDCFETRDAVAETADRLTAAAERLADRDARLHYHNHDFEFETVGDRMAYDVLVEATDDVRFELDVGWAAAGGADPMALLERHADRIDLVHLKDMDVETATPAELGEGDVDLSACVDAARSIDAEWLIYEYDWPDDPMASLAHGAEWFARNAC